MIPQVSGVTAPPGNTSKQGSICNYVHNPYFPTIGPDFSENPRYDAFPERKIRQNVSEASYLQVVSPYNYMAGTELEGIASSPEHPNYCTVRFDGKEKQFEEPIEFMLELKRASGDVLFGDFVKYHHGKKISVANLNYLITTAGKRSCFEISYQLYQLAVRETRFDFKTFGSCVISLSAQMKQAIYQRKDDLIEETFCRAKQTCEEAKRLGVLENKTSKTKEIFEGEIQKSYDMWKGRKPVEEILLCFYEQRFVNPLQVVKV